MPVWFDSNATRFASRPAFKLARPAVTHVPMFAPKMSGMPALKERKLPVAYLAFAGEGHGFRQAETIKAVLESELVFYGRVFGFQPAGELPELEIANL